MTNTRAFAAALAVAAIAAAGCSDARPAPPSSWEGRAPYVRTTPTLIDATQSTPVKVDPAAVTTRPGADYSDNQITPGFDYSAAWPVDDCWAVLERWHRDSVWAAERADPYGQEALDGSLRNLRGGCGIDWPASAVRPLEAGRVWLPAADVCRNLDLIADSLTAAPDTAAAFRQAAVLCREDL